MSLETAFRSFVLQDSAVAALLGERLYIGRLPRRVTLPAAWFEVDPIEPILAHDGELPLETAEITLNLISNQELGMVGLIGLRDAIRTHINGFRGLTADGEQLDRVAVRRMFNADDDDDAEMDEGDPAKRLRRIVMEIGLWRRLKA